MISLADIAQATEGQLIGENKAFSQLCTDTRKLNAGDTFLALVGENFDGHNFIDQAINMGASAVVCQRQSELPVSQILVDNTLKALGKIGKLKRQSFAGQLIAVTGSSGKTSVKNMLHNILLQSHQVLATEGNFNNQIGVPLTLLKLDQHDVAVIEEGTSFPGEIEYLSSLSLPDVAAITNIAPAHLEGFGAVEKIAEEKAEIYKSLTPEGVAVVNLDEPFLPVFLANNRAEKVIGFGIENSKAQINASDIAYDVIGRPSFKLHVLDECVSINLPVIGQHNIANALCAAACAFAVNTSLQDIAAGLENFRQEKQRMTVFEPRPGFTVIDDTYNANPGSVKAAIDCLARVATVNCLVLGDLAEIGPEVGAVHESLGRYAAAKKIQHLVAVGQHAENTVMGFNGSGAAAFENQDAALPYLLGLVERTKNITCLVKGSRSAAMEITVKNLCQREVS